MAKYIKCSYCGKRITFGEKVWTTCDADVACCSVECYASETGYICEVDDEFASNCFCTVYDDDKRKAELEAQIAALQKELETLTAQN